MSRVRILNLPNSITEDEVRQFILGKVPADAPRLDITDVTIVRSKAASPRRGRGRGGAHATSRHRQGSAPTVRMVFVGFVNASAGHYVVKFFDKTYFRSAKITVELAKGLNEVGLTTNMRKKQEKAQGTAAPSGGDDDGSGAGRKRARSPTDNHSGATGDVAHSASARAGTAEAMSEEDRRRQRRREEFIEARTKDAGGPAWAAELLVPQADPAANGVASSSPGEAPLATDASDTEALVQEALRAKQAEEEEEERALAKQRALGAVSDMDFLAQLGGGVSKASDEVETKANEEIDDGAVHARDDSTAEPTVADGGDSAEATTTVAGDAHAVVGKAKKPTKAHEQQLLLAEQEELARQSRRVRIGNLPYAATEEQVKQFAASTVGPVQEVHIPLTKDTKQSKGAAFVCFVRDEDAARALTLCRGAIFMGRLLRVSAAEEDPHSKRVAEQAAAAAATSGAGGGLAGASTFKKDRQKEARASEQAAGTGVLRWNTMFMNSHAAVETMAQRLGVRSEDVVGVDAKGAAVRAAIAEAYLTTEVQTVLGDEGVSLDVIGSAQENLLKPRSNTTIIVKNIQLKNGEEAAELAKFFARFGSLETTVFPAAGSFALFRFYHPQDARIAFTRLAYKSFHNAPLFLEWAPVGAIVEGDGSSSAAENAANKKANPDSDDDDSEHEGPAKVNHSAPAEHAGEEEGKVASAAGAVYTLFITNLPFAATEDEFYAHVVDQCPRLAKAPDQFIQRLVYQKEEGRAFLSLVDQSTMVYCQAKLHNRSFAGRTLSCVISKQTASAVAGSGQLGATTAGVAGTQSGVANDADDDDDGLTKISSVIARNRTQGGSASGAHTKVPPGCDPLRLIVKNLPFEATEKDVRELFSAFSEVRSVRVPTKRHSFTAHRENNHRGFAFVEFMSETEAARALETLKATHLYGRHLVLQYAKLE